MPLAAMLADTRQASWCEHSILESCQIDHRISLPREFVVQTATLMMGARHAGENGRVAATDFSTAPACATMDRRQCTSSSSRIGVSSVEDASTRYGYRTLSDNENGKLKIDRLSGAKSAVLQLFEYCLTPGLRSKGDPGR